MPAPPRTKRLVLVIPEALRDAIEDYHHANRIPTRTEAIRRLIEAGLEASKQRQAAE